MSNSLLHQSAIDAVSAWLDGSDALTRVSLSVAQRAHHVAAWELREDYAHLGAIRPRILLPPDFPFTAMRVALDPRCCLQLPHIEASGNFCHGELANPADLTEPVQAAGRVLRTFLDYVRQSADTEWVEHEFHSESHDYWLRHVDAAKSPKGCLTEEVLLEIDPDVATPLRTEALHLGSRTRAIVSTREGGPKAVAEQIGWSLGTLVRGSALVARLPEKRRWTPNTWPRSFESLGLLMDEIAGHTGQLAGWYRSRQWPTEAPLFVILLQGSMGYGWRIIPPKSRMATQPTIVPVRISRIDRRWTLARDQQPDQLDVLTRKRVIVFGCGSLGAPLVELLARAGVGTLEVVDPDLMRCENISRHPLGIRANGQHKATEFCNHLKESIPGLKVLAHTIGAQQWLAAGHPVPDLILDCTGDRAVRMAISKARLSGLKGVPTMMAWLEPFGAAAHVVTIAGADQWPASDPAEAAIHIADWPDDVEVRHAGCGQGFHHYGMADAWEIAALTARQAIAFLRGGAISSDVVSLVQARSYFERFSPGIRFTREALVPSEFECVVKRVPLSELLGGH